MITRFLYFYYSDLKFRLGTYAAKSEFPFETLFVDKEGVQYSTSENHKLNIELSKVVFNEQYSGVFSGEMVSEDGEVIQITEGRFDISNNRN